jgi:hypothetical protein
VTDLAVLVPVPQWLAEDLLGVMRAARDLPGLAEQIGLHLGCESGFVADVTGQLERVLSPYPLVSILPGKIRFFLPRGGVAPDDVVFMLRRVRPGRVHFQPARSGSAIQSMPEQVFFENHEELSRAEFVAATRRRDS